MGFLDRLRSQDAFGAPLSLSFEGDKKYKTLAGGIASTCLRLLIFSYLVMQTLAVVTYKDPAINGYSVLENRRKMTEPMNMADMHV